MTKKHIFASNMAINGIKGRKWQWWQPFSHSDEEAFIRIHISNLTLILSQMDETNLKLSSFSTFSFHTNFQHMAIRC